MFLCWGYVWSEYEEMTKCAVHGPLESIYMSMWNFMKSNMKQFFLITNFCHVLMCCTLSFEWISVVRILCACLHCPWKWNRQSVLKSGHIKSDARDSPKRKNTTWNNLSHLYVNIWIDFLVLPHPTCMDTENLDSSLFIW